MSRLTFPTSYKMFDLRLTEPFIGRQLTLCIDSLMQNNIFIFKIIPSTHEHKLFITYSKCLFLHLYWVLKIGLMTLSFDIFFWILCTFSSFLFLYFPGFGFDLWQRGTERRPGPGQVSRCGFTVAHPRIRAHALARDGLAWKSAGWVVQKVGLGVGTHGRGAFRAVRRSASQQGQVHVLAAQVSDRISAVGHQNVVP